MCDLYFGCTQMCRFITPPTQFTSLSGYFLVGSFLELPRATCFIKLQKKHNEYEETFCYSYNAGAFKKALLNRVIVIKRYNRGLPRNSCPQCEKLITK